MIVSDHGFAPFYYCMGINNFLIEKGFLSLPLDGNGQPQTVKSLKAARKDNYLSFVDWSKTQAYSLGLGKIFINLKGREPEGAVDPADYDKVRDEIIAALEAYTDPVTGDAVVNKVYKREEIFSGDFWREGTPTYHFYGLNGEVIAEDRYTEGFADLYLGFHPKYRVSWQTSLGGLEDSVIVPNEQKWSGDHVSVDPPFVTGIFFSNKKMGKPYVPHLTDVVPTVMTLFGLEPGGHLDGQPIPLENTGS
jgi:predicted AlkP superfamily phosphohydrolase/phosphomutase